MDNQNSTDINNEELMDLILEFQAVTGIEDMDDSRRILEESNWDLIQAISKQMGFEQLPSQNFIRTPDSDRAQPSTSSASYSTSPIRNVSVQDESVVYRGIPRGPPNDNGGVFGWIWKIVTMPLTFFFRYFWDIIGYGLRFIQQDPRRALTDPVQDVVTFITRFKETYGNIHPVFYQGTYGQALSDAKKELKFLLVYLHSDDHADTDEFCRLVLSNPDLINLVRENMLFWACSVNSPEGYRTSQALRENTYPFLALIVLKNHRMTIVARIEGVTEVGAIMTRLHQGVADNESFLVAERQDRDERSMTQSIRQQQDVAYQESLRADQEKERRKKEELDKKRLVESEKQRLINQEIERKENLKRLKEETRLTLEPEPHVDETDTLRVLIKLPNGTRLERRFRKNDSLKHLYRFVFSHPDAPDSFEIATNFPKRTLPCMPTNDTPNPPTFIEFGLGPKEMLFVYDLES